jgi:hypothetical protein
VEFARIASFEGLLREILDVFKGCGSKGLWRLREVVSWGLEMVPLRIAFKGVRLGILLFVFLLELFILGFGLHPQFILVVPFGEIPAFFCFACFACSASGSPL